MPLQTIQIELPKTLLERAHIKALDGARELITFLLEAYVQELENKKIGGQVLNLDISKLASEEGDGSIFLVYSSFSW